MLNNPRFRPPPAPDRAGRRCLVVWPLRDDAPAFPKRARRYLGLKPAEVAALEPTLVRVSWGHLWRPPGHRVSRWAYVLFDGPRGQCK